MTPNNPMELEHLKWARPVDGVEAFQVTRGTVSAKDPYSEFNLCDYTGDDALRVLNARLELCATLDIDLDHLVMPRQVHRVSVALIDEYFLNASIEDQERLLDGVDGLVTTIKGVCIGVNTADCVNIVLTDPVAQVVGVVHAGWRGTAARIARNIVEGMRQIGADPSRILATMGACICQDCYEVGDEVVEAFAGQGHDIDRIMYRNAATGKAHINLPQACAITLVEAGVPEENVCIMGTCTRCQPERYFSARRLGINSGRTFTGVMIS